MSDGKHTLSLSNGAARWLFLYLNQPGLFKTTVEVFNIGTLLASHLAACNLAEDALKGEAWEQWSGERFPEFEVSEALRDSIKRGLQETAKAGNLSPNKYTIELLPIFGLHTA